MSYYQYPNSKKSAGTVNVLTSSSSAQAKKVKKASGCGCGKKKKIIRED